MNKKKKINILLSCIAIIILIGFNGVMIVKGLGIIWSGTGGAGGINYGGCGLGSWCFNYSGLGMRISLVNKAGDRLGTKSYDVVGRPQNLGSSRTLLVSGKQDVRKNSGGAQLYEYNGANSIPALQQYLSSKSAEYLESGSTTWMGAIGRESGFNCADKVRGDGEYDNTCSKDYDKFVTYFNKVKDRLNSEKDTPAIYTDLNTLFTVTGFGKTSQALSPDELDDMYILFEPILMVHATYHTLSGGWDQRKYAYGTVTELYNVGTVSLAAKNVKFYITEAGAGYSESSSGSWQSDLGNVSKGSGVAWIKLSDLLGASNCFSLLKIVNDESNPNYWSGGTQTAAYHQAVAAIATGNSSVEIKDKDGTVHKPSTAYDLNDRQYYWLKQENYSKRTELKSKASCYAPTVPCGIDTEDVNTSSGAIRYLHYWSGISLDTPEYDAAIDLFKSGDYFYYAIGNTKNEDGEYAYAYDYFLIDKAYTDSGLEKANYGSGKAKCGVFSSDCDSAVDYIWTTYHGTPDYDVKIGQVRNGTFNEGGFSISTPQNFYYLIKTNYDRDRGGMAACDSAPPSACGEPANINIDNCVTGKSWVKDSASEAMWLKCETAFVKDGTSYASENTGHIATEDSPTENKIVGNREYCPVFCYEEIETDFPTSVYGVRAGQTFFWGTGDVDDGVFGTIKIKKTCKTQEKTNGGLRGGDGYLFEQWALDYKNTETARIDNWIYKGAAEVAEQQCQGGCNARSGSYYVCTSRNLRGGCTSGYTMYYCTASATGSNSQYRQFPNIDKSSYNRTYSKSTTISRRSPVAASECKNQLLGMIRGDIGTLEGNESDYQRQEKDLFEKIGQCTNRMKYVYETTIDFVFKEPDNGSYGTTVNRKYYAQEQYNDLLIMDPANADDGITTNTGPRSKCSSTKNFYWIICEGTKTNAKCKTGSYEKILTCDQLEWNIAGSWTYKYKQEDFIWFSLKYNKDHPDETLMNQQEKDEKYSAVDENLFYSIGFGLPTALSLPDGNYGTNPNSPMKVVVSKLGDTGGNQEYDIDPSYAGQKNYHTVDGHFQSALDAVSTTGGASQGFEYTCTYEVTNDMFGDDCKYDAAGNLTPDSPHYCDEHKDDTPSGRVLGIDVAYRLVSLLREEDPISKAFPGRDGDGRLQGSNWMIETEEIHNILRSDIYDNEAMYEIFLDVALIQRIREDNSAVITGDAYTSFENIICTGGNDKYCASEFVSSLARGDLVPDNYMVGTCLGETNTQARADAHGACDNVYTPLDISWAR